MTLVDCRLPSMERCVTSFSDSALDELDSRTTNSATSASASAVCIVVDGAVPVGEESSGDEDEKTIAARNQGNFLQPRLQDGTSRGSQTLWRTTPDWTEDSINGEHIWMDTNASGDFCYVSESECCKSGVKKKCSVCKVIIHTTCLPKLKLTCRPTCREASVRNYRDERSIAASMNHHWVHRKRQNGKCKQCGKSFQTKFPFNSREIVAIQCTWCKAAYHNKGACFTQNLLIEQCSLGVHTGIIVPPSWIIKIPKKNTFKSSVRNPASGGKRRRPLPSQQSLTSSSGSGTGSVSEINACPFVVKPIPGTSTRPVIVFINPKSGGNQGAKLMHKFQWLLNPRQVFDLGQGGPRKGLELFGRVPNLRILSCGGDGTAGWILSEIDALGITPCPPLAVLPLGTGNDLARTLNWGAGYTDEPLSKILCCVEEGKVLALDRWNVETHPQEGTVGDPGRRSPSPQEDAGQQGVDKLPLSVVNNYFSMGADAATALEFHESREANPEKFNSRFRNKMFYAGVASKDIVKRSWRDLSDYITLECDGMDMTPRVRELKPHCILFLNIPRYGAGTLPWGNPQATNSFSAQRMDDLMIEVVALSSTSLATLQVGGHGDRICQCKNVLMKTSKIIPMQVDGEPCRLVPSVIEITLRNQANLVKKPKRRTSMQLLDYVGADGMYGTKENTTLKLSVLVIPLVDYETDPFDKEALKMAARYFSVVTVDDDADLTNVRTQINSVAENLTGLSEDWVFLDSTTTDRFFRIDPTLESVHFISDICSAEVYILDANRSSVLFTASESKGTPPSCLVNNNDLNNRDATCDTLEESEVKKNGEEGQEIMLDASSEPAAITNALVHCNDASGNDEIPPETKEEDANVINSSSPHKSPAKEGNVELEGDVEEALVDKSVKEGTSDIQEEEEKTVCEDQNDNAVGAARNDWRRTAFKFGTRRSEGNAPLLEGVQTLPLGSPTSDLRPKAQTFSERLAFKFRLRKFFLRRAFSNPDPPPSPPMDSSGETSGTGTVHTLPFASIPNPPPKQTSPPLRRPFYRKSSNKMALNNAFLAACKQGNADRAKQLIEEGADILAVDAENSSGLHYAAKSGNIAIVHYLINNAPRQILELRDSILQQTALHSAASSGRRSMCSLLISVGASLTARDVNGHIPRDLAKLAEDQQLADFLTSRLAQLGVVDPELS